MTSNGVETYRPNECMSWRYARDVTQRVPNVVAWPTGNFNVKARRSQRSHHRDEMDLRTSELAGGDRVEDSHYRPENRSRVQRVLSAIDRSRIGPTCFT